MFLAGAARWTATAVLLAAVAAAAEADRPAAPTGDAQRRKVEPLPAAPLLLDKVIRGFLEAAPGRETLDDAMRRAAERHAGAVAAEQRRQLVRQQTQQFETMLQPLLHVELAYVKRSCASLPPAARADVLAAARQAVRHAAERLARLQIEPEGADVENFDVRRAIREKVLTALGPRAAAEELAAYERESRFREERRAEAARIRIVSRLDEQLGLTAAQRQALLDDLRAGWEAAWIRALDDHDGLIINGQPPAPDFAEPRIVPHLDPDQARMWRQWREVANWKSVPPRQVDWSQLTIQGPHGPQKPDSWWQP